MRDAATILSEHAAWARDGSGERIVWFDMPAEGRANLRSADLRSADLRGADLRGADLRSAYLSGASLVELPLADPRGYRLIARPQDDPAAEWLLNAGCRGPWTVAQCREHWGSPSYQGDPLIARRYLTALDWWEQYGADYRAEVTARFKGADHA